MDRIEKVRQKVENILRQQLDEDGRRFGYIHLYGVSATCVLLALKRGLDTNISATAGMLHDIWTYKTGDSTQHAIRGALEAEMILLESGDFTASEIAEICEAIKNHSSKEVTEDSPLSELLKDADIFQHYLYNPVNSYKNYFQKWREWEKRLNKILIEIGIG